MQFYYNIKISIYLFEISPQRSWFGKETIKRKLRQKLLFYVKKYDVYTTGRKNKFNPEFYIKYITIVLFSGICWSNSFTLISLRSVNFVHNSLNGNVNEVNRAKRDIRSMFGIFPSKTSALLMFCEANLYALRRDICN